MSARDDDIVTEAQAAEDEATDSPTRVWVTVGLFAVFVVLASSCIGLGGMF